MKEKKGGNPKCREHPIVPADIRAAPICAKAALSAGSTEKNGHRMRCAEMPRQEGTMPDGERPEKRIFGNILCASFAKKKAA